MGDLPVLFHPAARNDALDAHDWYAARSSWAAEAFQIELERAVRAIKSNPETWPSYKFGTRQYLLKRFPFVVVYRIRDNHIEIIAVAHGSRRPGYWSTRLTD